MNDQVLSDHIGAISCLNASQSPPEQCLSIHKSEVDKPWKQKKKESQIYDVNIKTTEEDLVCTDTIQVMKQKIQGRK